MTNAAHSSKAENGKRKAEIDQSLPASAATNDLVVRLLTLLRDGHSNEVSQITWQLGSRPAEANAPTADEIEIRKCFGPEAQILPTPPAAPDRERKIYFEELPAGLQRVLRVQLRRAGDVSAVIETSGGFLLYLATEKTENALSAALLSLPKRSYEQWLNGQAGSDP